MGLTWHDVKRDIGTYATVAVLGVGGLFFGARSVLENIDGSPTRPATVPATVTTTPPPSTTTTLSPYVARCNTAATAGLPTWFTDDPRNQDQIRAACHR